MTREHETSSLIQRLADGDEGSRRELLLRLFPEVEAFIRLRLGPVVRARESVSDLVQSAMGQALVGLPEMEFRSVPAFKGWLFAIVLRKVQMRGRHHGAQCRTPAREVHVDDRVLDVYRTVVSPSQAAMRREDLAAFEAAFDALPPAHRNVLILAGVQGLAHREMSEQLGISEIATRALLHRARGRLVDAMRRRPG